MVVLRQFEEKPQRVLGVKEFVNQHGKAGDHGLSVARRGSGRQIHTFSFEADDTRDPKSSLVVVSTVPFWFGPDHSIVARNHSLLLSDRLSSVQLDTIQLLGTDLVVLRVTIPIHVPGSNFVLLGRPPASGVSGPNTVVPLIDPEANGIPLGVELYKAISGDQIHVRSRNPAILYGEGDMSLEVHHDSKTETIEAVNGCLALVKPGTQFVLNITRGQGAIFEVTFY